VTSKRENLEISNTTQTTSSYSLRTNRVKFAYNRFPAPFLNKKSTQRHGDVGKHASLLCSPIAKVVVKYWNKLTFCLNLDVKLSQAKQHPWLQM